MAQHVADLAERGPLAHHFDGQTVTKLVSPTRRRVDSGTFDRMANHRADAAGSSKSANGRPDAKENAPAAARWPAMAQVVRNRIADLVGQGKIVAYSSLCTHVQRRASPVNVIKLEKGDFAQTKSQSCKQQQNGVVAATHGGGAIDASPTSATRGQNAHNSLISGSRKPKVGTTRPRAEGEDKGGFRRRFEAGVGPVVSA